MNDEEKIAMLELNRYVYGKQLSKDDIVDYMSILFGLIHNQQKEIEKYKRYFKLAISDLQSEGYMQMPYKNIEKYYSKREDIV